jgi:uncharacterized protein (TIGR02466 family)
MYKLFPSIVEKANVSLNQKEYDTLKSFNRMIKSHGNYISQDKYVLNHSELVGLKKRLTNVVQKYHDKIYKPKNPIEIFITQSWVNLTRPGEYHHEHKHPNSYLSGVFYIDVSDGDGISFIDDRYSVIKIDSEEYDENNGSEWTIPVSNNDVVIFRSDFMHKVDTTSTGNNRVSLAFNTFFRGYVGDDETSSGLHL